ANPRPDKTMVFASLLFRRMRNITLLYGSAGAAFRLHVNANTLLRRALSNYQDKRQRVKTLFILGQSNFVFSRPEVKRKAAVGFRGLLGKFVPQLFRFHPGGLGVKK